MNSIRDLLERLPLYPTVRNWIVKRQSSRTLRQWEEAGNPVPPPHCVKQQILREYAAKYRLRTLVETGTYYGDMVAALHDTFDTIYSIELSPRLHARARRRLRHLAHVTLLCGDSANELAHVLETLEGAALFWLDSHYSAGITAKGAVDTPIFAELTHIFQRANNNDIILIDDARCFGRDKDYPSLDALTSFVLSRRPEASVTVIHDIIRITPAETGVRAARE